MRILHVSLGWPPFRTGGLVRYCCDLMDAQAAAGHEVAMLFPAGNSLTGRARVRKGTRGSVVSYALYSRNMVPLVFGTSDPDALDRSDDGDAYRRVLDDFRPDVVHVHSIQGISCRFFEEVRERGVRTVFTTHDYYPICLRCNLMDASGALCEGPSPERCAWCNAAGLSAGRSAVMQSAAYRAFKDSPLVRRARRGTKESLSGAGAAADDSRVTGSAPCYAAALKRHREIVSSMDVIHANSELAAGYYRRAFPGSKIEVLPITHAGLRLRPRAENRTPGPFKIGYVGGANEYKGYRMLLEALTMLPADLDWELLFYGTPPSEGELPPATKDRVELRGLYRQEDAEGVFSGIDVLVVPSIWPETFSLVVMEALCVGTPVICSDIVGASYILPAGCIYNHNNIDELANLLSVFIKDDSKYKIPDINFVDINLHAKIIEEILY